MLLLKMGVEDKVEMLADGPGTFVDALGDLSYQGEVLGKRRWESPNPQPCTSRVWASAASRLR